MAVLRLRSPASGRPLRADGPHSLTDGRTRWPVVDGIPFLRLGRDGLRESVLAALDAGDGRAALVLLLRDQDDYAPGPSPEPENVAAALADPELTYRAAMEALAFGPVATYFAHRWSAPTFLSGLGLLGRYWTPASPLIEIACGTGQILLEAARHGGAVAGIDVVFAKLWLARRFLLPNTATLVCADVQHGLPLAPIDGATLLCHDAFYFLRPKPKVMAEMRRVAGVDGTVLIGHAHNARYDHGAVSGEPLTAAAYAELAPGCTLHDDAAFARWVVDREPVASCGPAELDDAEAISLATGRTVSAPIDFGAPSPGVALRLNPLLAADAGGRLQPAWPSAAFAREYASANYLSGAPVPEPALLERAARGVLDPAITVLARRRVLLGLPSRW